MISIQTKVIDWFKGIIEILDHIKGGMKVVRDKYDVLIHELGKEKRKPILMRPPF